MEKLEAFEKMLADIIKQADYEKEQMEKLKAEGKEKTATYQQLWANKIALKELMIRLGIY